MSGSLLLQIFFGKSGVHLYKDVCSIIAKRLTSPELALVFCAGLPEKKQYQFIRTVNPILWMQVFTNSEDQIIINWMAVMVLNQFLEEYNLNYKLTQTEVDVFMEYIMHYTEPWTAYSAVQYWGSAANWKELEYDYGHVRYGSDRQWSQISLYQYFCMSSEGRQNNKVKIVWKRKVPLTVDKSKKMRLAYVSAGRYGNIHQFKRIHEKYTKTHDIKAYWKKWLAEESESLRNYDGYGNTFAAYARYKLVWLWIVNDSHSEILMYLYQQKCPFPKEVLKNLEDGCPTFRLYLGIKRQKAADKKRRRRTIASGR